MALVWLVAGVIGSVVVAALSFQAPQGVLRAAVRIAAILVLVVGVAMSTVTYVSPTEVGIVYKNALGPRLTNGRIIATEGEMGIQANVLPPGWHIGYIPIMYTIKTVPQTEIASGEVGLISAVDGLPLDEGQLFAPDWPREEFQQMLDAKYFLTTGKGRKGKQVAVLTPGKYPINTELFRVERVKQTEIAQGEVGVLKANFGTPPSEVVRGVAGALEPGKTGHEVGDEMLLRLGKPGEMGVRVDVLAPGKYPLNTDAYTVIEMWTTQMIAQFSASPSATPSNPQSQSGREPVLEEREITVRTNDGFTFPVDVRVEYVIEPKNAPIVVAKLGDDEGERFRNALNSAVRAIFRNNGEKVRALDYVQQRSIQEEQSLKMLEQQMARFGVTVTAVRIGNVGDEKSLGALLKTQTDREIAKQEQITFQEQQKAAEKKKELTRVTQEAEEEKRLATSAYEVKIADEQKKRRITEAGGEAEAIRINAQAQAEAYRIIANEIGKSNAALIELLKIVGERNILITPRVLINNGPGGSQGGMSGGEGAALIGTMLDQMMNREERDEKPAKP